MCTVWTAGTIHSTLWSVTLKEVSFSPVQNASREADAGMSMLFQLRS